MSYTPDNLLQIIGTIGGTAITIITAIVAAVAAIRAGRVVEKVSAVETKVDVVEKQTNSQLVSITHLLAERDLELKAALQKIIDQDNERYRLAQTVRAEQLIKAGNGGGAVVASEPLPTVEPCIEPPLVVLTGIPEVKK